MRNKALTNYFQPNYSPFFFDPNFDDDMNANFLRDFQESDDAYFTTVDIPGVSASDINIDVEDSYIRITAERKDSYKKDSSVYKKYEYAFSLPKNIDKESISAHYENGVLNLALNKSKKADSTKKKIAVSTGEKPKFWSKFLNADKDGSGKVEESNKTFN
jgi:HSP20 family protein